MPQKFYRDEILLRVQLTLDEAWKCCA